MSAIGQRIKELRIEKGVSQYKLSKLSGIAQSTISAIEAEGQTRSPAVDTVDRIAAALGLSASEIMEQTKKPTAGGDGLDQELIDLLSGLSPQEVQRVRDFVAGLIASRAK